MENMIVIHVASHFHDALGAAALIRLGTGFPTSLGRMLFENHWAIWAAMILIGLAAVWRGINTQHALTRNIGTAVLAITVIWIITAGLVVTPHERLIYANDAIVSAAADDNVPAIMHYISRSATFGRWNYAQIQSGLAGRLKSAHITDNIIRSMTVHTQANQAVTQLVIWTSTRDYGPVITSWRFIWQDHPRPGNWRIMEIDLLRLNGRRTRPDAVIPMPP
jgi:hypothetical protein